MVIRRIKGDTYPIEVQIESNNGDDFDLTGCTVFFTVKKRFEDADADALIVKSTTSHTTPTQGITSISLTSNDVDIEGSFYYDIKVKDSGGIIYSVASDKIIFERHITIRTS